VPSSGTWTFGQKPFTAFWPLPKNFFRMTNAEFNFLLFAQKIDLENSREKKATQNTENI
jgi:hypothetical protein